MRGGSVSPRSPKEFSGRPSSRKDADPSGGAQPDETQLFREAVRDVKPLGGPAQAAAQPSSRRRRPRPTARFSRADRLAVLEESLRDDVIDPELASGEELAFRRTGIQAAVLRKLRRGEYRVQGEIDLHGLTVSEAKQALREFLAQALMRQWRCVRIIHGKGLRSGHRGPVLKGMVSATLRKVGPVLAYVSARQVDGGTGAVYVLLSS
jgi:DNA-nicking Smr family endonuclease